MENNITLLLRYPVAENQDKGNDFILQGEKLRRDINNNFLAMRVDKCRHELKGEILKHHSFRISITQLNAFVVAVWLVVFYLCDSILWTNPADLSNQAFCPGNILCLVQVFKCLVSELALYLKIENEYNNEVFFLVTRVMSKSWWHPTAT